MLLPQDCIASKLSSRTYSSRYLRCLLETAVLYLRSYRKFIRFGVSAAPFKVPHVARASLVLDAAKRGRTTRAPTPTVALCVSWATAQHAWVSLYKGRVNTGQLVREKTVYDRETFKRIAGKISELLMLRSFWKPAFKVWGCCNGSNVFRHLSFRDASEYGL